MTAQCSCYPLIGDYAVIGDCHTATLISREGSIDRYCPTRFDAPAAFCRLLDADKGGCLSVRPVGAYSVERRYRGPTNVLETTFTSDDDKVRVTDLMPIHHRSAEHGGDDVGTSNRILRLIESLGIEADLEIYFRPTFGYARADTALQSCPDLGVVAYARRQYLTLAAPGIGLEPDDAGGVRGCLRLKAGEQRWLVLTATTDSDHAREALASRSYAEELSRTLGYWQQWASSCTYRGPYRAEVLRSALALKLLIYEPTGAIIAAPTTSLPEQIGGVRNWDYRYAWLRDASLILYALLTVGYRVEAADFFHWLQRTQQADPTGAPQVMYIVTGERELPEIQLDYLEGYRCSRPVRIGNAAADQCQLDIFGEVLRATYMYLRRGNERPRDPQGGTDERKPMSHAAWKLLRGLVEQAAEQWQEPDNGIWEVRSGRQRFLYSRLMCWAAVDRGLRLAQEYRLGAPLAGWRRTREAIRHAILTQGYNTRIGAFTQAFGSSALDASVLVIPQIGFLPATDPRVQSTVEQIRRELTHEGLVYWYRTEDGLPGGEATFALCSFWLVDALALGGRLDDAHDLFEQVVSYANDLGLLSEEIDPTQSMLLGNFPQGFTHLALIRSAVNLAKAAKHGAEEQPETEAERAGPACRAAKEGYAYRSRRH